MKQRKRKAGNLSRFHGTKQVILKPVIRGSNIVVLSQNHDELIPRLGYFDALSCFEYWMSKASDLRDVLTVRVTEISGRSSFGR